MKHVSGALIDKISYSYKLTIF